MKLSYFEQLSPDPVRLQNVGGVLSPTLRRISALGYDTYQTYLAVMTMDPESYLSKTAEDRADSPGSLFSLLTGEPQSCALLQNILNFFMEEDILYSPAHNAFLSQSQGKTTGYITEEIYPELCSLICQRSCIHSGQKEKQPDVKSKKALEILQKLQKGRTKKARQTKPDKDMELGNIISAVASRSYSLNLLNIWDLTIFQLWDCFARLSNNNIYDIQSMAVAAWGSKDNSFDASAWFKRMEREE